MSTVSMSALPVVPHLIANAMAPVFLLAGIGSFLNVISLRLARAVDRWRVLDDIEVQPGADPHPHLALERALIDRRIKLANLAISLCVGSALCVCLVVILVFLNPIVRMNLALAEAWLFIVAMLLLAAGILAFLGEVRVAVKAPRTPHRSR